MPEGGFFEQKRVSPVSLAIVIALHAAAITALLVARGPQITATIFPPTEVDLIEVEPDPEPVPEPRPPEDPRPAQRESVIERPPRIVETPSPGPPLDWSPAPPLDWSPAPPARETVPPRPKADPPAPTPPAPPVRTEAQIDPRYADRLQPPYPTSEERAEREGTVRIRVTIGTDGRVKQAERVSATSDAFWRATERQARSQWRFRPATLDGRPVEAVQTLTVRFELPGR